MVKFDEQAILENGAYIYAMRQEIEQLRILCAVRDLTISCSPHPAVPLR